VAAAIAEPNGIHPATRHRQAPQPRSHHTRRRTVLLLSMTGHGEAHRQFELLAVSAEVRAINSRYFKISYRGSEGYGALEANIEAVVRQFIRRGTVQVNLKIDRRASPDDYHLNLQVLEGYRRQLEQLGQQLHLVEPIRLDALVMLPGVADETATRNIDLEADWPSVEETLAAAMQSLLKMREDEGRAMADDLRSNCQVIGQQLTAVEGRAPRVVEAYRDRLTERLRNLLAQFDVSVNAADVVREVGLFAERCDISEEIVRLRSHLEQFDAIMKSPESNGRKLDFLTQELFREANTIGSKANDAEIARHVVEMKTAIERMREMVQNVE
jgi:uncharacterized protein (TIGR00255 family)